MSTPTQHHTARWPGDEGYDRMKYARAQGWQPVSSWGRDGWDLGSWPLVVLYHRGNLDLAVDVEGDIDIYVFGSEADRSAKTDETALFYWQANDEPWSQGIASVDDMPPHLRGAYTRARAAAGD